MVFAEEPLSLGTLMNNLSRPHLIFKFLKIPRYVFLVISPMSLKEETFCHSVKIQYKSVCKCHGFHHMRVTIDVHLKTETD